MSIKIIVFEVEPWERVAFEPLQGRHEVRFEDRPLTPELAATHADADVVSTFIYSDLSAQVLGQFENLKLVATRSTGFDHIDADFCQDNNVVVANVPTYGENTVAEHVFALLLVISHGLVERTDRTRRGDFSQAGLRGFDLRGKTLSVIGTDHIGLCVARIAKGFGTNVIA